MADRGRARFATTQWSLVAAAADARSGPARPALAELCEAYWYPLYAFARRGGSSAEDARDLTQGFFAELLEKGRIAQADRERGRFRTFLLAAFRHFASKQREKGQALKRGGGVPLLSLDYTQGEERYATEPTDTMTPQRLYERRWAMTLLARVLDGLREEYSAAGKGDLFAELEPTLDGSRPAGSYREIGDRVGMQETAVKVAAHRLRRRYNDRLRAAIAATLAEPERIEDELRHLIHAVSLP